MGTRLLALRYHRDTRVKPLLLPLETGPTISTARDSSKDPEPKERIGTHLPSHQGRLLTHPRLNTPLWTDNSIGGLMGCYHLQPHRWKTSSLNVYAHYLHLHALIYFMHDSKVFLNQQQMVLTHKVRRSCSSEGKEKRQMEGKVSYGLVWSVVPTITNMDGFAIPSGVLSILRLSILRRISILDPWWGGMWFNSSDPSKIGLTMAKCQMRKYGGFY